MILTFAFAFLAGLVTVASPCILPILPVAVGASLAQGRARPLGVALGLAASFSAFTLVLAQLLAVLGLSPELLRLIAVAVIGAAGLSMIVPALHERLGMLLGSLPGLARQRHRNGFAGGLAAGAAMGLVWAPCAGPVLAAISTLAATQRITAQVVAITLAYALGAGIPLLAIAYGGRTVLRRAPALARRSDGIQRGFGALMVAMAALIGLNADVAVTAWATSALPSDWNNRLQAFEGTPAMRAQLDQLLGRTQDSARVEAAASAGDAPALRLDPASAQPLDGSSAQAQTAASPSAREVATPASPSPASGQPAGAGTAQRPMLAPDGGLASQTKAAATPRPTPLALTPTQTPVAPTSAPRVVSASLPDAGLAPDFTGITRWLDSPALRLADLRGKVVLVNFWTFECINCIHTLPSVTAWYARYHTQGLVVVGVHTPEFQFEHDTANVQQAMRQYGIAYPVAQDNNYATWNAYRNEYWPAEYLIDKQGHVRYTHFGEGSYDVTERAIQELLAETAG